MKQPLPLKALSLRSATLYLTANPTLLPPLLQLSGRKVRSRVSEMLPAP
jgi:hypothetical protein